MQAAIQAGCNELRVQRVERHIHDRIAVCAADAVQHCAHAQVVDVGRLVL